jgi:hypothetical protein
MDGLDMDPDTAKIIAAVLGRHLPYEGPCGVASLRYEGGVTFQVVITPRNEKAADTITALDPDWSEDFDGTLVYNNVLPEEVPNRWEVACALAEGEKPHPPGLMRTIVKAFGL